MYNLRQVLTGEKHNILPFTMGSCYYYKALQDNNPAQLERMADQEYYDTLNFIDNHFKIIVNPSPQVSYFRISEFKPLIEDSIFIIHTRTEDVASTGFASVGFISTMPYLLTDDVIGCFVHYRTAKVRRQKSHEYFFVKENDKWVNHQVSHNKVQCALEKWVIMNNLLYNSSWGRIIPPNIIRTEMIYRAINRLNIFGIRRKERKTKLPPELKGVLINEGERKIQPVLF